MKAYEKGRGDTSFRLETEYRCNEAGAKQYVLDQIARLEKYEGGQLDVVEHLQTEIGGVISAYVAIGLLDYFDVDEILLKRSKAYGSAISNILNISFD